MMPIDDYGNEISAREPLRIDVIKLPQGLVRVQFSQPVTSLDFTQQEALEFSKEILAAQPLEKQADQ